MLTALRVAAPTVLLLGAFVVLPSHTRPDRSSPQVRPTCATLGVSAAILDSIDDRLASVDSVWGGTSMSGRSTECVQQTVAKRGIVLVAVAGGDERTGGIAVVDAGTKQLLSVEPYAAARELTDLATGRLLFTYTPVRELMGAGLYESRYVILCALGPEIWVPCFDLPKDRITRVFGGLPLQSLEEHNHLSVADGGLRLTRRIQVEDGSAPPRVRELAPSTLAIP